MELGRFGIWWSGWRADDGFVEAAPEMEEIGYRTLWMSGGRRRGVSSRFERLLKATSTVTVASGIISIWQTPANELAQAVTEVNDTFAHRLLLGLGVSHEPVVEESGQKYERPFHQMVEFLDELDAADPTVPTDRRILAALGPKMLRLAADRSSGAHPYFVPAEHTAIAREILGSGPTLAPEVAVVLQSDASRARELARDYTARYLALPNYVRNLRQLGYSESDVAAPGSDHLVDDVVPWGSAEVVAARIRQHIDAGADHVCVQIVTDSSQFPAHDYRRLAEVLVA